MTRVLSLEGILQSQNRDEYPVEPGSSPCSNKPISNKSPGMMYSLSMDDILYKCMYLLISE